MEGFATQFGQPPARQEKVPKSGYPGGKVAYAGKAAYPGKFEKPHTHKPEGKMMPTKPRQHKRF